jgi:hypothetical protein
MSANTWTTQFTALKLVPALYPGTQDKIKVEVAYNGKHRLRPVFPKAKIGDIAAIESEKKETIMNIAKANNVDADVLLNAPSKFIYVAMFPNYTRGIIAFKPGSIPDENLTVGDLINMLIDELPNEYPEWKFSDLIIGYEKGFPKSAFVYDIIEDGDIIYITHVKLLHGRKFYREVSKYVNMLQYQ